MKQLRFGYSSTMAEKEKAELSIVRYTLRVPTQLSIMIEMAMENEKTLTKNEWFIKAIEEKLGCATPTEGGNPQEDALKALQKQVEELQKVIMKK